MKMGLTFAIKMRKLLQRMKAGKRSEERALERT